MCDEVIFRGRYLHTIEDLRKALDGGEIVPGRQYGYTDDDLLPHCCLCPSMTWKTIFRSNPWSCDYALPECV